MQRDKPSEMLNYPLAMDNWDEQERDAIDRVVRSNRFTMGEQVKLFESEVAAKFGSRFAVMVNSGSSANILMLTAAKIYLGESFGKKPNIIVPSVSWSTTYTPSYYLGFELKFVDIDSQHFGLNLENVESAVDENTVAILTVNLLGSASDLTRLKKLAEQKEILLSQNPKQIIHIWEDQWITKRPIIESRIQALFGQSKRIHARATSIKRLNKKETEAFLNANHLQGETTAYYKYGLLKEHELVAVATFSKSRMMNDGVVPYRSYEWVRFANKNGITVVGGIGKLLNHFIEELHPAHIMTYIDLAWSDGKGYQKIGFKKIDTVVPKQYMINPNDWIRIPSHQFVQMELSKKEQQNYLQISNVGSVKMIRDLRNY